MSANFTFIKKYYDSGRYTIKQVANVVGKRTGITNEEYQSITGFVYPNQTDGGE